MSRGGVTLPVLSAIGCGIFADGIAEVPRLYARSLRRLLCTENYQFGAVCLCLPGPVNFDAFAAEFAATGPDTWRCPVTLVRNRSAVTLADQLARQPEGPQPGLLNPSDPLAVRAGYVGMFWDGGASIGMEELLAVQTTLLTQHKGPNPDLWQDACRHRLLFEVRHSLGGFQTLNDGCNGDPGTPGSLSRVRVRGRLMNVLVPFSTDTR